MKLKLLWSFNHILITGLFSSYIVIQIICFLTVTQIIGSFGGHNQQRLSAVLLISWCVFRIQLSRAKILSSM